MPNLNDLATTITKAEGGKQNLSIGQVKEVLKITLTLLAEMPVGDLADILRKYAKTNN